MTNHTTKHGFVLATILLALTASSLTRADDMFDESNRAIFAQPSVEEALALEHIRQVAVLSVDPRRLLPEPTPIPARFDPDADGVPSAVDNCPNVPNPRTGGEQPQVCGSQLRSVIDNTVFLRSRTFVPRKGVDPALSKTPALPRVHALLHLTVSNPTQRNQLEEMGVYFLSYVPRNTFMVSVPRDTARWAAIVAVNGVRGLSAMDPADRVAPKIRLYGPDDAENQVSSVDVEFFTDTAPADNERLLASLNLKFSSQDATHYTVEVRTWQDVQRLALEDSVKWIEDTDDGIGTYSQNTWLPTETTAVMNETSLRGNGLVVAIGDSDHIAVDHPALVGRVTKANAPVGGTRNPSHANKGAAIMVSDGTAVPEAVGFLPEADLITYRMTGTFTTKRRYYHTPTEAREDFDAALINNSWGSTDNCNKIGEYTKKGEWRDKAVHDSGILIVDAAGNRRGVGGSLDAAGCGVLDLETLPHTQAKNDLMVGNWDIIVDPPALNSTSAAGPTPDGRMKPDIVAPGNNVETIDYIEDGVPSADDLVPALHAGTSAAAPVASGIAGLVYEQLLEEPGVDLIDIPADQVKAILIHTAKDVGLAGPDFRHGYGLVQAAPAVRIASEWSQWGRSGNLANEGDNVDFTFTVEPSTFQYKATLAWTDVEGSPSATLALVNDLDLTLISQSGATYYPWDLTLPAGNTIPAVGGAGPDRVNNVEQVVVSMPNGAALETGTWTARVTADTLVEQQWFSLVLTPPCPIVVTGDLTLTGDVECASHELVPAAVEIVGANAVFDCAGYEIRGNNGAIGVNISANGVNVTNCEISNFQTGIESKDATSNAVLRDNQIYLVHQGMVMTGNGHRMIGNTVSDVGGATGKGIVISGDNADMIGNVLAAGSAASLPGSVGIEVLPGSDNSIIEDNDFSGFWQTGILLRSALDELPIQSSRLIVNEFEGIGESAVVVSGNVPLTVVDDNEIAIFGQGSPAILVEDVDSLSVENAQLLNNTIIGSAASGQMGIQLKNATEAVVRANQISDVGTGINEESCKNSQMSDNVIWGVAPFFVSVGIASNNSEGSFFHINGNSASRTLTGIAVSGPGPQNVSGNTVAAYTTGISVDAGGMATSSSISSNTVAIGAQPAPGIGISVSTSPGLLVQNNAISNSRPNPVDVTAISVTDSGGARINGNNCTLQGDAILVNTSDDVELADNVVDAQGVAMAVQGNATEITDNTLTAAVGIRVSGDQCLMERNTVDATTGVGIHLSVGLDAILRDNEVTPAAGTGVRLGSASPPCVGGTPITVDNALLENNVISGTPALDILCDVGAYTVVP